MKAKKIPLRRCAGCMESKPKKDLIRIVSTPEGEIRIDLTGKANGRGVYLCPKSECFALARKKKAIGRSLDVSISEERLNQLFEELKEHEEKDS